MENAVTATSPAAAARRARDAEATRAALAGAAARLLPDRSPSSITGRQLADEAGVNYGLVHHHFGGKDAALAAGMSLLRDDFVERFGDGSNTPFLGSARHPFLRAMVHSMLEWPDAPRAGQRFRIVESMVDSISDRLAPDAGNDETRACQARARAIAAVALQIFYGVFGDLALDAVGTSTDERAAVEHHLAALYDQITAR